MPAWVILPWLQHQYKRHLETGQQRSQQTARLSACFIELPGFSCSGIGVSKVQKSNSKCEKRELFTNRQKLTMPSLTAKQWDWPKDVCSSVQVPVQHNWNKSCPFCYAFPAGPSGPLASCLPTVCAEHLPQLSLSLDPGPQSLLQLLEPNIEFLSLSTGSLVSLPLSMTFISCHTAANNNIGCNLALN